METKIFSVEQNKTLPVDGSAAPLKKEQTACLEKLWSTEDVAIAFLSRNEFEFCRRHTLWTPTQLCI